MKTKLIILFISFLTYYSAFAQLNIENCYTKARQNYPLIKQYDLIEKSKAYTLENLGKNYLPQLSLDGQATYQSDVTAIPIDFTSIGLPVEIPSLSKDQYKATIKINQMLWDGGQTYSQRKITKATRELEKKKNDVSLYEIEVKVSQLYFGILAANEKLKVLDLKKNDIQSNKETIESMFKNGTTLQSDLDQINVELLNLEQERTTQLCIKKAYCKMLSLFIHEVVPEDIILLKPNDQYSSVLEINRPELFFFDSQTALIHQQNSAITAKNMPKISLFANGGYGRPGLNMLKDDFEFFAVGGIKLVWNFGNLYTKKNERRILDINKKEIDVQRETFLFNINQQLTQKQSEIGKYKSLLMKDNEIIELRNRIKKASESKYRNGVYQTNELIKDINAEEQARESKALHEIQYLFSIEDYKHLQGR